MYPVWPERFDLVLCLGFNLFCNFSTLVLTDCSLRPRTSSSSSQSERSTSPLVMSSTHSLETMPRFALSTDDEGKTWCLTIFSCFINNELMFVVFTLCRSQLKWWCQTSGGSGFEATAPGPNTRPLRTLQHLDALATSWRHQTDRNFPVEEKFPNQPPSQLCPSSSQQVRTRSSPNHCQPKHYHINQMLIRMYLYVNKIIFYVFQTTHPLASSPVPFPHAHCLPTPHLGTRPLTGISVSALGA